MSQDNRRIYQIDALNYLSGMITEIRNRGQSAYSSFTQLELY